MLFARATTYVSLHAGPSPMSEQDRFLAISHKNLKIIPAQHTIIDSMIATLIPKNCVSRRPRLLIANSPQTSFRFRFMRVNGSLVRKRKTREGAAGHHSECAK